MPGQIDSIIAELTGSVLVDAVVDVTLEVHAALVEATPVDTGNARANWIAGIGAAVPSGPVEGESAQGSGLAAVLGYKAGDGPTRIVNNVDYIEQLAAGSSSQAPAGWDRVAIETGIAAAIAKAGAR